MARTVRDARLDSRTARLKLKAGERHWRAIDAGLHLGYWRGERGGSWLLRRYIGAQNILGENGAKKLYTVETIGRADDTLDADGHSVLNFNQAQAVARERFAAANKPASAVAAELTVKAACEAYIKFLRAERKTADDTESRLRLHVYPDVAGRRDEIKAEMEALTARRKLHASAARKGSERAKARLARIAERETKLRHELAALPTTRLGDKLVRDLTTDDIEQWKRGLVHRDKDDPEVERRSKDSANRVLTMLKAALNRVFQDESKGITTDAAWRRVKPFHDVGRAREVFLDQAQSLRLVNVTKGGFRDLVTAALITGARPPHELVQCRARDFRANLGTLPVDGKTGRRDVVLTGEAIQFFKELCAGKKPDDLLFVRDDSSAWGANHHIRPMKDAVAKAKLPKGTTIYSLRHTHASQAILNGANLKFLAENMGTSIRMLEQHYGKFIAGSRRKLIEESGFKLGLKPGNVHTLGA
jgi:site-specific recombinase XerD